MKAEIIFLSNFPLQPPHQKNGSFLRYAILLRAARRSEVKPQRKRSLRKLQFLRTPFLNDKEYIFTTQKVKCTEEDKERTMVPRMSITYENVNNVCTMYDVNT